MNITTTWIDILGAEKSQPYFLKILEFLHLERQKGKIIYPNPSDIFNAFKETPYKDVKVVLLGQDPYHGKGQAHGLSFSVNEGVEKPPSLKNILQELHADLGVKIPIHGCLKKWANQGVLLLNTSLSVEAAKPQSHAKIGWGSFTDRVIAKLNDYPFPLVFLLWGAHAKQKQALLDGKKHLILTAPHPSPFSAHQGFLGCRHFSKTNAFLASIGREIIDWAL
ncbi:MAG: uracil-DNA glycosylase [Legionellales bacterium RIFCSPHIGHO2_12_FULL_37_14]|nr:MAG: uracil-DNA glycosylase [Legionellales bacterium RIFCSPHIGHO2_12_FULL_37_14]